MPMVDGKHYPYTEEGQKAAKKAMKKKMSGKGYSKGDVEMARKMMG